jgi:hypothetical protein
VTRHIISHQLDEIDGEENPLESIVNTIVFSSADWAEARDMAWLYGIVMGWDPNEGDDDDPDSAMAELAQRFSWTEGQVARLRRLHTSFRALRGM